MKVKMKPTLIFSFDHAGNPDIKDFVMKSMNDLDIRPILYVQTGIIAAKRWNSTVDDLAILYENGWDLGTHTVTHASLGYLNAEAIEYEVATPIKFLNTNGFYRGCRHLSYPQSSHSSQSITVVKKYCETARLVTGKLGSLKLEKDGFYLLDCISMKATDSPSKAINAIEKAIVETKCVHIMFEMIFKENPPYQGYPFDNFLKIINFASDRKMSSELDILTMSEFFSLYKDFS